MRLRNRPDASERPTRAAALCRKVAAVVAQHVKEFPPAVVMMMLPDVTRGTPDPGKRPSLRPVALLFTDELRRPEGTESVRYEARRGTVARHDRGRDVAR
jgi:hypothetical protein